MAVPKWARDVAARTPRHGATCDYYGRGSNTSTGYCQNDATWDLGRRMRVTGLPYEVQFSCDEHAARIVPFAARMARPRGDGVNTCPDCGSTDLFDTNEDDGTFIRVCLQCGWVAKV